MSRLEAFKDGHSFMERRQAQLHTEKQEASGTWVNPDFAAKLDKAWHDSHPHGYFSCHGPGGTQGCGFKTEDPEAAKRHTAMKGAEHSMTGMVARTPKTERQQALYRKTHPLEA